MKERGGGRGSQSQCNAKSSQDRLAFEKQETSEMQFQEFCMHQQWLCLKKRAEFRRNVFGST